MIDGDGFEADPLTAGTGSVIACPAPAVVPRPHPAAAGTTPPTCPPTVGQRDGPTPAA